MRSNRIWRYSRSVTLSFTSPAAPKICTAASTISWATSVAYSFAMLECCGAAGETDGSRPHRHAKPVEHIHGDDETAAGLARCAGSGRTGFLGKDVTGLAEQRPARVGLCGIPTGRNRRVRPGHRPGRTPGG